MTDSIIRKIAAIVVVTFIAGASLAQDPGPKSKTLDTQKVAKPFRILSDGQRITIQSNKDINRVIVWTASGNRFVEQNNIEVLSYNFTIPSKEKYVFVMIEVQGGRRFTEKIGVQ